MDDRDDEIEALLRRYRPAGPPGDLRARCLQVGVPVQRVWPWAAAAALLLAVALGLQARSTATLARAGLDASPDAVTLEHAALVEAMGGGAEAEQVATVIVAQQQLRRGPEPDVTTPMEPQ